MRAPTQSPATVATGASHPSGVAVHDVERIEGLLAEQRELLAVTQERIARLEAQLRECRAAVGPEERVVAALEAVADDGWVVLGRSCWPGGAPPGLDHVVVGPGGVVVIDAKDWSGPAAVRDGVLRIGFYRKDAACETVARRAAGLASFLGREHRGAVTPVLCLVGPAESTGTAQSGVDVVRVGDLEAWLRALPTTLDPAGVCAVVRLLEPHLAGGSPLAARVPLARAAAQAPTAPTVALPPRGGVPRSRRTQRRHRLTPAALLTISIGAGAALSAAAYLQSAG